jgi:hypothetical protein
VNFNYREIQEGISALTLSPTIKFCAVCIMWHTNSRTGIAEASVQYLAEENNVSRSTMTRAIRTMIEHGILSKLGRNYRFNPVNQWSADVLFFVQSDTKVSHKLTTSESQGDRSDTKVSQRVTMSESQTDQELTTNVPERHKSESKGVSERATMYDVVDIRCKMVDDEHRQHPSTTDFDSQFTSTNGLDWENQIIGQMRNCGYDISIQAAQTVMRKYKSRGGEMYACVSWVGDKAVDYQARQVPQNRVARYLVQDVERAKITVTIKQNEPDISFL